MVPGYPLMRIIKSLKPGALNFVCADGGGDVNMSANI